MNSNTKDKRLTRSRDDRFIGGVAAGIARRLGISIKTVEAHASSVLRKLQLSTRHELSRWAAERDLID
ncbi:MAG: PspC domain-containing protein [Thermoleophilia bacterium]|nr:PspC domain-containing protein [Thermoleophilia bacterium]